MNQYSDPIYKEYKYARDNIQLKNAYIVDLKASRSDVDWEKNYRNDFSLATRMEESSKDGQLFTYLKAEIKVIDADANTPVAEFLVICRGEFNLKNGNISVDELKKMVDIQSVPQLIPYIRAAISTLSTAMAMPPLTLPTLDIINSIQKNREVVMEG